MIKDVYCVVARGWSVIATGLMKRHGSTGHYCKIRERKQMLLYYRLAVDGKVSPICIDSN